MDLRQCPVLVGDFLIGRIGERLVSTLAVWDKRRVNQAVVRAYDPVLGSLRPLINLVSPLLGMSPLPRIGEPISMAFLSHVAVEGDRPVFFLPLVNEARRIARRRELSSLAIGLASRNPLARALKNQLRIRTYPSTLFAVFWPDQESIDAVDSLDGRVPGPEVAVL